MTEDEILKAADLIRARRRNEARLASFLDREEVTIRWDNDREAVKRGLGGFDGIIVPRSAIEHVVKDHFASLVDK